MTQEQRLITVCGLDKLRHAVGFRQAKASGTAPRTYATKRNCYMSSVPDGDMEQACGCGLVVRGQVPGGDYLYWLTQEGFKFLSEIYECEITGA